MFRVEFKSKIFWSDSFTRLMTLEQLTAFLDEQRNRHDYQQELFTATIEYIPQQREQQPPDAAGGEQAE